MNTLKLAHGNKIPVLGLGTWRLQGSDCEETVETALALGYRHIDTAEHYQNQIFIGRALQKSALAREEIFLTSKVWRDHLEQAAVRQVCEQSLQELQTEYLDLFLIHWPNHQIPLEETLTALEQLRQEGLIRAFGVSNFTIKHLKKTEELGFTISVNQVEYHPSFKQEDLKEYCRQRGIILVTYSPLGQGQDLSIPLLQELGKKYNASAAQIILAWILQQGMVAIPRSRQQQHLADNLRAAKIKLTAEEIDLINQLPNRERLLHPPYAEF